MEASLTIVGSGIKFLSHLTYEARVFIEKSDKVLFLVNEPAMKQWIKKSNPRSECLEYLYNIHEERKESYKAISNHILDELRKKQHLCVVFYGHPSVFCNPGLDAIKQAKKEGFFAKILPGISADACLFADLLIDPGSYGCQSFEATDFLLNKRKFDYNSHLILWQIDIIGALNHGKKHDNSTGIRNLANYLLTSYNEEHEVIIYEAAQYPTFEPSIEKCFLSNLHFAKLSRISTLYVPPKRCHISEG